MVSQVQNLVSLEAPLDILISTPISISQPHQPSPKHIILVPRGVTFRDSNLGSLMLGEIFTQG